MIDLVEEEYGIDVRKNYKHAIDRNRQEKKESLIFSCELFGLGQATAETLIIVQTEICNIATMNINIT